jgi:membrane-associated protein
MGIFMTGLTDLFLRGVISYGVPIFALALFIGAIGIPIPTTLLVIAGGAFIRQGTFDVVGAFGLGLCCAVFGDSISFLAGKYLGKWMYAWLGSSSAWSSAECTFKQYGGAAVYSTRFLLTSIAIPVNLIAGGTHYSYKRFLLYVLAGEGTWLVVFGFLGYLFGSQWEVVNQVITNFGVYIFGIFLFLGVIILIKRFFEKYAYGRIQVRA